VVFALGCVFYYCYVGCRYVDDATEDSHEGTDRIVRFLDAGNDVGAIDVSAHYRTNADLFCRRFVSIIVFLIGIAIQIIVNYYLTRAEQGETNIGVNFAISFVAVILNTVYTFMALALTEYEKHQYMSSAIRWTTLKLFLFKIANIMTVFAAKDYNSNTDCVYKLLGSQFFTLWFVELFVGTPGVIIGNMIWHQYYELYGEVTGTVTGDNDCYPAFNLPIEYLKVIYKMFLTVGSMTVFPLAPCIACVVIFIEYWGAKFRLFKLCGVPPMVGKSERFILVLGMLLITVAGLLTPYAGAAWILSGNSRRTSGVQCSIPTR